MSSKTHQKNFPTLFLSMYIFQIIYFRQGIINLFPPQRCLIYFRTKHLKIFRKFRKEQARNFEFEILNTILIDFWSSIIIPDFLVQCILRYVTPRFVPSFLAIKKWSIGGCTVFQKPYLCLSTVTKTLFLICFDTSYSARVLSTPWVKWNLNF